MRKIFLTAVRVGLAAVLASNPLAASYAQPTILPSSIQMPLNAVFQQEALITRFVQGFTGARHISSSVRRLEAPYFFTAGRTSSPVKRAMKWIVLVPAVAAANNGLSSMGLFGSELLYYGIIVGGILAGYRYILLPLFREASARFRLKGEIDGLRRGYEHFDPYQPAYNHEFNSPTYRRLHGALQAMAREKLNQTGTLTIDDVTALATQVTLGKVNRRYLDDHSFDGFFLEYRDAAVPSLGPSRFNERKGDYDGTRNAVTKEQWVAAEMAVWLDHKLPEDKIDLRGLRMDDSDFWTTRMRIDGNEATRLYSSVNASVKSFEKLLGWSLAPDVRITLVKSILNELADTGQLTAPQKIWSGVFGDSLPGGTAQIEGPKGSVAKRQFYGKQPTEAEEFWLGRIRTLAFKDHGIDPTGWLVLNPSEVYEIEQGILNDPRLSEDPSRPWESSRRNLIRELYHQWDTVEANAERHWDTMKRQQFMAQQRALFQRMAVQPLNLENAEEKLYESVSADGAYHFASHDAWEITIGVVQRLSAILPGEVFEEWLKAVNDRDTPFTRAGLAWSVAIWSEILDTRLDRLDVGQLPEPLNAAFRQAVRTTDGFLMSMKQGMTVRKFDAYTWEKAWMGPRDDWHEARTLAGSSHLEVADVANQVMKMVHEMSGTMGGLHSLNRWRYPKLHAWISQSSLTGLTDPDALMLNRFAAMMVLGNDRAADQIEAEQANQLRHGAAPVGVNTIGSADAKISADVIPVLSLQRERKTPRQIESPDQNSSQHGKDIDAGSKGGNRPMLGSA